MAENRMTGKIHWTEGLSPSEQLRLAELRIQICMKLADKPRNKYLWNALYETYGGKERYEMEMGIITEAGERIVGLVTRLPLPKR